MAQVSLVITEVSSAKKKEVAMPKAIIPFNKNGTFGIQSIGTPTVTATDVTLHFEEHPFINAPYNGMLIVEITSVPATSALPVFFQAGNGAKVAVTKAGGVPLTAADIQQTGYYLLFFDRGRGILQTFNSVG